MLYQAPFVHHPIRKADCPVPDLQEVAEISCPNPSCDGELNKFETELYNDYYCECGWEFREELPLRKIPRKRFPKKPAKT